MQCKIKFFGANSICHMFLAFSHIFSPWVFNCWFYYRSPPSHHPHVGCSITHLLVDARGMAVEGGGGGVRGRGRTSASSRGGSGGERKEGASTSRRCNVGVSATQQHGVANTTTQLSCQPRGTHQKHSHVAVPAGEVSRRSTRRSEESPSPPPLALRGGGCSCVSGLAQHRLEERRR